MIRISYGHKNEFEPAIVNKPEPSGFKSLRQFFFFFQLKSIDSSLNFSTKHTWACMLYGMGTLIS